MNPNSFSFITLTPKKLGSRPPDQMKLKKLQKKVRKFIKQRSDLQCDQHTWAILSIEDDWKDLQKLIRLKKVNRRYPILKNYLQQRTKFAFDQSSVLFLGPPEFYLSEIFQQPYLVQWGYEKFFILAPMSKEECPDRFEVVNNGQ